MDRSLCVLASHDVIERHRLQDPLLYMGTTLALVPIFALLVAETKPLSSWWQTEPSSQGVYATSQDYDREMERRTIQLKQKEEAEREVRRQQDEMIQAAKVVAARTEALRQEAQENQRKLNAVKRKEAEKSKYFTGIDLNSTERHLPATSTHTPLAVPRIPNDSAPSESVSIGMPDFTNVGTAEGQTPQKPTSVGNRDHSAFVDIADLGTPEGIAPPAPGAVGLRANAVVDLSQIIPGEGTMLQPAVKSDFDMSQAGTPAGQAPGRPAQDGDRANLVIDFSLKGTPKGVVPSRPKNSDEP